MAEVGLVRFGRLALEVSQAVLLAQRTKFSKRQFTQPQLLGVLCLMRYDDWTFRETEVRLREHTEPRPALQLNSVPDYTTLYRFLARLDPAECGAGDERDSTPHAREVAKSGHGSRGCDGSGAKRGEQLPHPFGWSTLVSRKSPGSIS